MSSNLERTLDAAAPPEALTPPLKALWWLRKGGLETGLEWRRAHEICQTREGERAHDLVHALAHLIEGDLGNADYWYRRARSPRQSASASEEWDRITAELAG
jgi:hypothetical protein